VIRLVLPAHLRNLARVPGSEVEIDLAEPGEGTVTLRQVLAALERRYPMLRGTIRDPASGERRPFLRFFACGEDLSHGGADLELPAAVVSGAEPLLVVGAVAGG